jgi:hypothetical protein
MRVVLVDNASGDDSVPKIREAMRANGWDGAPWLDFRPFEKNLGFAGGNNAVLREFLASADCPPYLMLLNSDTLVRAGCLEYCLGVMDKDPKIGAMSCMLLNRDGSVQNVCRKFPTPLREGVRAMGLPWILPALFKWADLEDAGWDRKAGPRDVEWIGGAFFLARAETLRKAGVLDEEFFFYGEDCEWCHRIWKHGWRIHFDPGAETVHLGGASSDTKRMRNRTREMHTWRARFLVQRKCYGPAAEALSRSIYAAMFALRFAWLTLRGGRKRDPEKYDHLRENFAMVTGRLDVP